MKFQDNFDPETKMFRVRQWDDEDNLIADERITVDQFISYSVQRTAWIRSVKDPNHAEHCECFD